jgi:hypothetical protein
MNGEVERIQNLEIVVSFDVFSWHLPRRAEENNRTSGRMISILGWDLNPASLGWKSEASPLGLSCSVGKSCHVKNVYRS